MTNKFALMTLAEELCGLSLLDTGTVNPFFLLASGESAYEIQVDFANEQQKQFTTVKIAALLQAKACDHYTFATRIQFPAQAGDSKVMKQQVLILFANKTADGFDCIANLFDLKLNQELGRPQLVKQQQLDDFDGQFSNLFEAPPIPEDLLLELTKDSDNYLYKPS
ncbi:MAG: hypothetical protein HKP09_02070 [Enterobacterales bacterium]|nr:hypothetical protein [Enterobacterales bacterium]